MWLLRLRTLIRGTTKNIWIYSRTFSTTRRRRCVDGREIKNVSTLLDLAKRRRRRAIISASECFEINVELFVPFNAIIIPFCFCQKHKWHKEWKRAKSSPSLVHGVELRLMLHVSHVARLSALVKWWKQKFSQTNAESAKKRHPACVWHVRKFSIKSITNHNNGAWAFENGEIIESEITKSLDRRKWNESTVGPIL